MLGVLEELNDSCFLVGDLLNHDVLKLFSVLVKDFKLVSEIVKDTGEGAVAVCADELDALLAAELADELGGGEVGVSQNDDVELVEVPGGGSEGLQVFSGKQSVRGLLASDVVVQLLETWEAGFGSAWSGLSTGEVCFLIDEELTTEVPQTNWLRIMKCKALAA